MKLIVVGLGNPQSKYQNTRHNAGRGLVSLWAKKLSLTWQKEKIFRAEIAKKGRLWLARPREPMNRSGEAVRRLVKTNQLIASPGSTLKQLRLLLAHQGFTKKNSPAKSGGENINLLVVHDELDMELGRWRLSWGKSSPLHKGVISVEQALKTKLFWRLRIGIDNRPSANRLPGETYVLQKFLPQEKKALEAAFEEILG